MELFSFVKPLAGLIEEHLDLGATTTDRQVLNTYLQESLPNIPALVGPKRPFITVKKKQTSGIDTIKPHSRQFAVKLR